MHKSLRIKFLVLLFAVSLIALSAAFFLRELMIRDFGEFLEGEREDRIYWITADIERNYEKHSGWNREALAEDSVRALTLGFETRVLDEAGEIVTETQSALASLPPPVRSRILSVTELASGPQAGPYLPYPLFVHGKQTGVLEVRMLKPRKPSVFIERSNSFLLLSLLALGGVALGLSIILSKKLTTPLRQLASAAAAISEGNLKARVPVESADEIGSVAETFNRMAGSLETQEELRKKLLSNAAHELRTPLGAIRGELEAMMDGKIQVDQKQLQSLHEEAGRLKKILDSLDDLAQAQAAALTLKKQPVLLKPYLQNIVDRTARTIRDQHVEFSLECASHATANADPSRLGQMVINLLDNSVKAVRDHGKVNVRAVELDDEVVIEVHDTGKGIKPEDLPFIFERFYRASEGGTGLGLAIVKELAEAHGGSVGVTSEYGAGSVFALRLPAALHNSS